MKKKRILGIALAFLMAISIGAVVTANAEGESPFGDWEYFYSYNKEILTNIFPKKFMRVPTYRQGTYYTCGVACVQSILRYTSYEFDIREDNLIEALGSNDSEGTHAENIVNYLNAVRLNDEEKQYFNAEIRKNMSIEDLEKELRKNNLVICALQAWNWDENYEYRIDLDYINEWECGHYAIAIGYDKDNIFFMDPSTSGSYTFIPKKYLDARWHDYDGAELTEESKVEHAGIVVKINVKNPDGEKYANAFYALM